MVGIVVVGHGRLGEEMVQTLESVLELPRPLLKYVRVPPPDELKKLLPKAKTYVVENCGHLPQAEKADEFVELVCR